MERTWLWCRRNPAFASLIAAVALALAGGTGVSSYYAVRATRGEEKSVQLAKTVAAEKIQSDQHWYNAEITLAAQYWQQGRVDLVLPRLDKIARLRPEPSGLRGLEWGYLKRLCRLDLGTLAGHTVPVLAVASTPDGRFLASGGRDGTVRLWDVALQKEVRTLAGHVGAVRSLVFGSDWLASAGDDHIVRLWDLATGQAQELAGAKDPITCLALSADKKTLAASTANSISSDGYTGNGKLLPGTVLVWDLATRRLRFPPVPRPSAVWVVTFSPDAQHLAVGGQVSGVSILSATDGATLFALGAGDSVHGLAFSRDGTRLAWGNAHGRITIWNTVARQPISSLLGPKGTVNALQFSADGRSLASAGEDFMVRVWDISSGEETLTLRGHQGTVHGLVYSPNGGRLASCSADGTVKLWDAHTSEESMVVRHGKMGAFAIAVSRTGRIAAACQSSIVQWDASRGRRLVAWPMPGGNSATDLAFTPDGLRLVSANSVGEIRVWNALTGETILVISRSVKWVGGMALSPDGNQIAACGEGPGVLLFDAKTGRELRRLLGHRAGVQNVAYDDSGALIASASVDGTVKIWDSSQGQELQSFEGPAGPVWGLAFQPGGNLVACGSMDGTVRLWELGTGKLVHELPGHRNGVLRVCFSPDGKRLVTTDWGVTTRVWDVSTGADLIGLSGHTSRIFGTAFSPDGLRLATASVDGTVRVWDSSELTPETLEWRNARSVLLQLASGRRSRAELIRQIELDRTISDSVRRKALTLVEEQGDAQ